MDEQKFKRIVGAATVTAVILAVILVVMLIYQLLSINTETSKMRELEEAIAEYERLIEEEGDTIEARSQKWWIIQRARELGYRFKEDDPYFGSES